ncbi:MAG: flavin monoamine oxidase family protein [Oligoflexus sp.]
MSWTRRELLFKVGQAAGVGAVYQTIAALGLLPNELAYAGKPQLVKGHGQTVCILGSGVGGMAAAYELQKAGFRCMVLEAQSRPGGRNRTIRSGDIIDEIDSRQYCNFDQEENLYFNAGPARIAHHHRAVLDYCREFGIDLEIFCNENRAGFFHSAHSFDGKPISNREYVTDCRGYLSELLAKAIRKSLLDQELSAIDQERLLDFVHEYGDLDASGRYLGSKRAGYQGSVTGGLYEGQLKVPRGLDALLKADFWTYNFNFTEDPNQAATMLQPKGGMDRIVQAFYERIADSVYLNTEVVGIFNRSDDVEIVYQQNGELNRCRADFVISTLPLPIMTSIKHNFGEKYRQTFASVTYDHASKFALQSPRFWEEKHHIYGGITWTSQTITQLWYPSSAFHNEQGVLVGAYVWDPEPMSLFQGLSPHDRERLALREIGNIHPELINSVQSSISYAWGKIKYQQGSWAQDDKVAPELLRSAVGRVYFAGDYMSHLSGWQEGAIRSAHHVIQTLSHRVQASAQVPSQLVHSPTKARNWIPTPSPQQHGIPLVL